MIEQTDAIITAAERILVTGSNGFVGVRVVDALLQRGYRNLRCFVRPLSRLDRLKAVIGQHCADDSVELVKGDLMSREDSRRSTEGVSLVYHLAAGFDKSFAGAFMNSALATRNLIEGFAQSGTARRFVNVSSFAVYSNLKMKRGAVLDESCALEDNPQERYDAYGFGKLKQEEIAREYGRRHRIPIVNLRPGTIYGPGKRDLTGRIGVDTFGFFIHIGGSNQLPMTYVDNCADAIVLAGLKPGVEGETFNVVDDETLSSREFLRAYQNRARRIFSVPLPYFCAYLLSSAWERYSKWSQGQLPPAFNRRRCAAEWKGNTYSNARIRTRLGWTPKVGVQAAMDAYLGQFKDGSR